jgi:tetratricopeptide (TPR) repeat protein
VWRRAPGEALEAPVTAPRVLLVYANPAITATPVTPYGMERVAQVMRLAGCEVTMLAPFIEAAPLAALQAALAEPPDLVGFSVRNLDDALVVRSASGEGPIDTTFYLDDVRPLVAAAVEAVGRGRVVLGGAAVATAGGALLDFLGADLGIAGPAEDLAYGMGRQLAAGLALALPADPRVLRRGGALPARWPSRWAPPPGPTPRMGPYLGLALTRGGRAPVQLSAGCDRRCHFCVEARFLGHGVASRAVEQVVAEIDALAAVGVRRFWLTASELNVPDERGAIALLKALAGRGLELRGFVQVAPVSDALLDAMEDAGLDPEGLSFEFGHLDETILRAVGGPANRRQIAALVETWLRRGYRTLGGSALLGAHWLETEETLERACEAALAIDAALPGGLGLAWSAGARVYASTPLADWIRAHPDEARPHLYSLGAPDLRFVRPVVYARPMAPRALLAWLQARLAGAKGQMGPMNAEAPADARSLAAEALVNRGIWRLQEDQPARAAACFREALSHAPAHAEALAQLARVCANQLGDAEGARKALARLLTLLPADDPRDEEVRRALAALGE